MRFGVAALIAAVACMAGGASAETCMKTGEQSAGTGTICTYRCSFGETTQSVSAGRVCPMTA